MSGNVCVVCDSRLEHFADGVVLGDRRVEYSRCSACHSVTLPDPDWLDDAYSDAITPLDVGLLERCVQLANVTTSIVLAERLRSGTFLDFAGGYGTLTRMMRDRGFDFRHHDPYCENIFARGFDGSLDARYDLVTAFEAVEHLADPVATLAPVAAITDLLLVTTTLLPDPTPLPGHWDYYAEETGQHVLFLTVPGLRALARRLGMQVTTSGRFVHLLHRRSLSPATRLLLKDERLSYVVGAVRSELARRSGLLASDRRAAVERLGGPRA